MAMGFLDSLTVEQMIAFVEETFGIVFDDGDFAPGNIGEHRRFPRPSSTKSVTQVDG